MDKKVRVSAPGKLMLFGEHAVVYGKPSIVTAVNQRLSLKATVLKDMVFELNAPEVEIINYEKNLVDLGQGVIPKGAKFIEIALMNFFKKNPVKYGVRIETSSEFKATFGFGSSSAATVCTIYALSKLFDINLTKEEIFKLSYKTVLDIQGVGSGFDLAAAIYGGTIFFVTGGKVIKPLPVKSTPLIVGYTGIKADTTTLVNKVNKKLQDNPKEVTGVFASIEHLVLLAQKAFEKADFEKIGELMNLNQSELERIDVSSKQLDNLISAARKAGAYGAKLSGAGGGDCMIALGDFSIRKNIERAIEDAGGQVLRVDVNAEGVKIEKS